MRATEIIRNVLDLIDTSVTVNAGGGWNGPKNPADIRANSVSMYPNFQAKE